MPAGRQRAAVELTGRVNHLDDALLATRRSFLDDASLGLHAAFHRVFGENTFASS